MPYALYTPMHARDVFSHQLRTQCTPCFQYYFLRILTIIHLCSIGRYIVFQTLPDVLNWIQVWRVGRPIKNAEILRLHPFLDSLCCVTWSIVLLEYDLLARTLQFLDKWHQVGGQYLGVCITIHVLWEHTYWACLTSNKACPDVHRCSPTSESR